MKHTCFICGKTFEKETSFYSHLGHQKEISPEEYYLKFIFPTKKHCEICGSLTRFISIKKGYTVICSSKKCHTEYRRKHGTLQNGILKSKQTKKEKYGNEHYNNRIKAKKTCLKKYGVENIMQHEQTKIKSISSKLSKNSNSYFSKKTKQTIAEKISQIWQQRTIDEIRQISDKANKSKLKNGNILPNTEKTNFELYRKEVRRYSEYNKKFIKNTKLRGKDFELDHKISIFEGFNNNIVPWIIGSKYNLEIISKQQNRKKHIKCSITLEELFYLCAV